jgi:subtilisin family serine protease
MHLLSFCLLIGLCVANDDIFIQLRPLDFTSSPAIRAVRLAGGLLEDEGGMLWRQARRRAISMILKEHARKAQAPIIDELKEAKMPYKSFWINNSIWVHGASPMFQMLLLAKFKAAGKQLSIVPDRIVAHIPKPPVSPPTPFFSSLYQRSLFEGEDEGPAWNLRVCKVPEAWRMSRGAKVTVATIDTGVFAEHAELKSSYRGSQTGSHAYNWFDPQRKSAKPDDEVGHGTHTMGTIVGAAAGVAPEATWISARGCTPKGCTQHDLLASAQWVMCPTGPDGVEDCDQGADLVSNSWGAEPSDGALEWFQPIVKAWLAAGSVPIFAIGNAGPACGSTGAPGNYANVIAVGSTGPSNMLSPVRWCEAGCERAS